MVATVRNAGASSAVGEAPQGEALFIIGVAGVGKSTLSRHMALSWPAKRLVDVATIRQVLRESEPDLALSTYDVWRLAGSEPTPENLTSGFERYAELLWPWTLDFLKLTANDHNRIVIEGAIFSPRAIASIRIDGLTVHACMLHIADAESHYRRLMGSASPETPLGRRMSAIFEQVRTLQEYLRWECEEVGIPSIENVNLEASRDQMLAGLAPATTAAT